MRKLSLILATLFIAISLLITACQSESTPTPAPEPVPQETPTPTPEPQPELEPEPIPEPEQEPEPGLEPISEAEPEIGLPPGQIELKYDDGNGERNCSCGVHYGYAVRFSPPETPFKIKQVRLYTSLSGTGYESQLTWLDIRDQNNEPLYTMHHAATEYSPKPAWEDIDLPDICVDGDFYVIFYPASAREGGVQLYYDTSRDNACSVMVKPGGKTAEWIWEFPEETTNWMIRAIGEPAPEICPLPAPAFEEIIDSPEFSELVNSLSNPELLSVWMSNNLQGISRYEEYKETGINITTTPDETFQNRMGNCSDMSIFACYVLQYHGHQTEILSIKIESDESRNHAVCVYHHDDLLYIINNGRIEGPFQSYEEICIHHDDNWSSYEIRYSWVKAQKFGPADKVVYRN